MDASLIVDQQTWQVLATYGSLLGFALFGSFMRAMFGLYRGYTSVPGFKAERGRMAVEMLASTTFGIFLAVILNEIGTFKFAPPVMALLAGLFGTDLMSLLTKKLGMAKGMNVILSEQQMKYAGMTDRQIRTMEYVRRYGSIDNRTYRDINGANQSSAKRDLQSMVDKGSLRMTGNGKSASYVPTRKFMGEIRAVSGPSKTGTQKPPANRPEDFMADFEACRRLFQGSGKDVQPRRDR